MTFPALLRTCSAVLLLLLIGCGDDAGQPGGEGAGGSAGGATAGGAPAGGAPAGGAPAAGGGGGTSSGGAGPMGCLEDVSAGHHVVTCEGGITYDVEIPTACEIGPCGLVVDLHGYTMTGDTEDENTGMRALGQANGYVIVQPTAPADNFGFPSWDQSAHVPLVYAFLADLASALPIDKSRVHAMGFSQGGGMALRLMCRHADFFASIAPIGGLAGCEFTGGNTPTAEVSVLQVHGRLDAIVNFGTVAVPQRDAILGGFPFGAPAIVESDSLHTATRWTTPSGTALEFWEHDYQTSATAVFIGLVGHCVPGGDDFEGTPAGYSCEDRGTFVFGELAMQFFKDHPKR